MLRKNREVKGLRRSGRFGSNHEGKRLTKAEVKRKRKGRTGTKEKSWGKKKTGLNLLFGNRRKETEFSHFVKPWARRGRGQKGDWGN